MMYGHMTSPNLFGLRDIIKDPSRLSLLSGLTGVGKNPQGEVNFFTMMKDAITMLHTNSSCACEKDIQNNTNMIPSISSLPVQKEEAAASVAPPPVSTTKPLSPTRSMRQIVKAVGRAEADLLNKINNALTKDARLKHEEELRDKIIQALRDEGYTVSTTDCLDKISINGEVYDVIRNHGVLGKIAKVQLNNGGGRNNTNDNNHNDNKVKDAIFTACEDAVNLLLQLRGTTDPSMQDHLASMIQQMVVDNLNSAGYTASAQTSPDVIMVNGVKYDFIRGLGTGNTTQFAALRIG